jgi:hypothetical protein
MIVFTLQQINPETVQYNSSAYIKVQLSSSPTNKKVGLLKKNPTKR